ncbi:MAG: cobalamin-dependent protein [Candidatus Delongbacteria bacterium]|nr:cobalamin-dependent protein [Candidatus Delongbacteria bacterium]
MAMITAYGDQLNDGKIQLSFTLPLDSLPLANQAAKTLLAQLGLKDVQIVKTENLHEGFVFVVAYASIPFRIDTDQLEIIEPQAPHWNREEIDQLIGQYWKRPIRVIGACIETDAHTVGIDAILNMKGYHGDYGLERYHFFETYNLGAQVSSEEVIRKARQYEADVILISQIVTQNALHYKNLTRLEEMLEAEDLRHQVLLICGGPRLSHAEALELGYDAGFGAGTVPSDVASFIVDRLIIKPKGISL